MNLSYDHRKEKQSYRDIENEICSFKNGDERRQRERLRKIFTKKEKKRKKIP